MSVLESLFVGVFGIAVVFIVLFGLSLLVKLQSALIARFSQKKPAEVLIQPTTPKIDSSADSVGQSEGNSGNEGGGDTPENPPRIDASRTGGVRCLSGGTKKKFIARLNGKVYEAEVEEVNK